MTSIQVETNFIQSHMGRYFQEVVHKWRVQGHENTLSNGVLWYLLNEKFTLSHIKVFTGYSFAKFNSMKLRCPNSAFVENFFCHFSSNAKKEKWLIILVKFMTWHILQPRAVKYSYADWLLPNSRACHSHGLECALHPAAVRLHCF